MGQELISYRATILALSVQRSCSALSAHGYSLNMECWYSNDFLSYEAPAVIKTNGQYFIFASQLTGTQRA